MRVTRPVKLLFLDLALYSPVVTITRMFRQIHIQQTHVLPTQCVCVFCVDLRTNSDYFPIQR